MAFYSEVSGRQRESRQREAVYEIEACRTPKREKELEREREMELEGRFGRDGVKSGPWIW